MRLLSLLMLLTVCAVSACSPRNPPGQMELQRAAGRGDLASVESMLRDDRLDVNWRAGGTDVTPLISATSSGRVEMVRLLLRMGANPNISTSDGFSPLHAAVYVGNVEIMQLLIDGGANVNAASSYGGTPLASAAGYNRVPMIRMLLAAGASRELPDSGGMKPVDIAKRYRFDEAAELLQNGPGTVAVP